MSQDRNHLNRATWECKYHIAFTPQYRKKVLFGQIRRALGHCIPRACPASGLRRMWNAGCA
ncbi:MAG TPA: transposase, partial [Terriglobales bacterium]|nr:transposase [Terriglobales bacterium]